MTEYYTFYDNKSGKEVVPVAFSSQNQADNFIEKYQNYGGIRQFNYDHYGTDKKRFSEWLEEQFKLPQNLRKSKQIVSYKDYTLFKYMMSMFGVRLK